MRLVGRKCLECPWAKWHVINTLWAMPLFWLAWLYFDILTGLDKTNTSSNLIIVCVSFRYTQKLIHKHRRMVAIRPTTNGPFGSLKSPNLKNDIFMYRVGWNEPQPKHMKRKEILKRRQKKKKWESKVTMLEISANSLRCFHTRGSH